MKAWPSRLGWPGAAAALALAAAVPLATWFTPHWQEQALRALQRPRPAPLPATPLAALQAQPVLPAVGDPDDRVADLLALALRHGVAVDRTQQQRQRQGPVQRLQLALSARARHADLRGFVAAALQADPGLALDSLQLRRASADLAEFEAELRWSLLQGENTAQAPPSTAARLPWPPAGAALLAWSGPPPPPPPPASAAALATKPPTPPFPYRWIGRLDDGADTQALLAGPLRSFGARAGDVLDGRWRLDRVAAARLQLTWLPTGEAVTVDNR